MTELEDRPSTSEYRDRRAGLILFGIVLIVIGAITALMAVMLLAGPLAMPGAGAEAAAGVPPGRELVPGAVTYAALAVMFLWLGAGSVLTRRWAPPLILTVAWLWLITGVVGVGASVTLLPSVFAMVAAQSGPMPDDVRTTMAAMLIGMVSVVMVVVPGALVLFYRSQHVLATCLARDPVPRWTDRRPPSLIGLSLSLLLLAVSLLPSVAVYNGLALCFGAIVTGVPGTILNVALAAVWGYCAWSTLRLEARGWWTTAISFTLATSSAVVTLALRDPIEIWRTAGLRGVPVEAAGLPWAGWMIGFAVASWLSVVAYLIYVRRHFRVGA